MKRFALLSLLLLLLSGFSPPPPASGVGYSLRVLEMDESGLVLEFRLLDFSLEERWHEGVVYQTVAVPGLTSLTGPGQPQLPGLGTLLGAPAAGVAEIRILETEVVRRDGLRLLPTPALAFDESGQNQIETFTLDADLYTSDAPFPGALAEVGLTGRLREQPVAQVRLYPFQYNPARQTLVIYRRLRVQVVFAPSPTRQADAPGSKSRPATPYEQLLRGTLLNYAGLSQPPAQAVSQLTSQPIAQAPSPALKIFVEEDGLYQITYTDLQNAGFNLSGVDPRWLQLTVGGDDVPIYVSGEADGVFDPGDWLEFYGTAITTDFATRNVYWLTAGEGPGLRMAERDGAPTGIGSTPTTFFSTLHLEENHEYWQLLPNGEGQDHWFWERFPSAPHSSNFSFELKNVADLETGAFLRVRLHGRTTVAAQNPDHHTQIFLNGTLVDDAWWDGQVPFVHEIIVPQQLFQEGTNVLRVNAPGDTGAGVDSLYVNSIDIGYWDTYVAENDRLYFAAPAAGLQSFTAGGYSNSNIHLYDITDPLAVSRLVNGVVEPEGGAYRLRFEDNASTDGRYLALTAAQKRTPAGFQLDSPSSWRSPNQGADYVIITHEDFAGAIAPLAGLRAGQGLRVATVQVTDIYDEFNDGVFDPQAIRDFLSYAYHNWTPPAPLYVLLVGDANYDYLDHLNTGAQNFVPTHLFESALIGQTPSDNWFVSVSGDDPLPDMFIGRLSVRTSEQATTVVNKILAYEQDPTPQAWQQTALFVADDEASFETISDDLIAALPANYTPQRIYAGSYPQPYDPTADILASIDQGTLIVNYIGHGSVTGWGSWPGGDIFHKDDIFNAANAPRYPLLVTGNCNNGLFAHPTAPYALAEQFLWAAGRGGIAAWSPTGLGFLSWHDSMVRELYQAIFRDYLYQLGPATTAAKIAAFGQLGWTEPVEIFTLFGDPALALAVVQPRLSLEKEATVSHVQAGESLTYLLTYANQGNYQAENVVLTEVYDPRTAFNSASPAPTGGDNVWQIGSLPAGVSQTVLVTVGVSETITAGVSLANQATLSGDALRGQTAMAHTVVGQSALGLSNTAATASVRPGQLLTYTLVYTNYAFQTAGGLVLTETYDAHTTFQTAEPPPTAGDRVWEPGSLPAGGSGRITITVRVLDTAPNGSTLLNRAVVSGDGLGAEFATAYTVVEHYLTYFPLVFHD
ncbi:MAG: C25 family cysteine peptidase [Anaerolineae bacterium]